jgi:hypothetical protein
MQDLTVIELPDAPAAGDAGVAQAQPESADMGSADDYLRAVLEAAEAGGQVDWDGVGRIISRGW